MSSVFFSSLKVRETGFLDKIVSLLEKSGIGDIFDKNKTVGIKLHFGEKGNTSFVRPQFIERIASYVETRGMKPFLFDTTALYSGSRSNAVDHIRTAIDNGFKIGYPIIIGDGLFGEEKESVEINQKHFKNASIAKIIYSLGAIVSVAHFKCHLLAGFGGAIKNISMGCSSKEGKLKMHSSVTPFVDKKECINCGLCVLSCSVKAISVDEVAEIDENICMGCGSCIAMCNEQAIKIKWDIDLQIFQERLAEYCHAVVHIMKRRLFYVNFLMNVTPSCDCFSKSDTPIIPDIGVLASTDPVAIDQACCDLVNDSIGIEKSRLKKAFGKGEDKFRDLFPEVDWEYGLHYAEQIGLGTRKYTLKEVE